MTVVGITGQKRSGKDTVAEILVQMDDFIKIELPAPLTEELVILNPWCKTDGSSGGVTVLTPDGFIRFADLVELVGIDQAKDISSDVRAYQQRYGTDIVRDRIDEDRWCNLAKRSMREARAAHLDGSLPAMPSWQPGVNAGPRAPSTQPHFVLPNVRAQNERELCDVLIRVRRPGFELDPATDHPIEHSIEELKHDFIIENDGTLGQLHSRVFHLWGRINAAAA